MFRKKELKKTIEGPEILVISNLKENIIYPNWKLRG
jgi:hypothetical protein